MLKPQISAPKFINQKQLWDLRITSQGQCYVYQLGMTQYLTAAMHPLPDVIPRGNFTKLDWDWGMGFGTPGTITPYINWGLPRCRDHMAAWGFKVISQ